MHVVKTANDVNSKFPRLRSHGPRFFGTFFDFVSADTDIHNLIQTLDARSEVFNALDHLPFFVRPLMKYFVFDPVWYSSLRVLSNLGAAGTSAFQKRISQSKSSSSSRKDLMGYLLNAKDLDTGGPPRQQGILAEAISFIRGRQLYY
jgi:hypothetical protein